MSCTGMPSATTTIVRMPVSMASMMASAANGGGTKMPATSAPVRATASCTVSNRGMPRCVVPPLPGVTPATTWVPILIDSSAWKLPCWPVRPWITTREDLFINMLMGDSSARGAHDAFRHPVAAVDAGEDVDQHRLDVLVQQHDPKGVGDFFRRGAAAHVEKIRRPPAVKSDGVHGGHGESGAVDDAPDIPFERDVVEAMSGGFDFLGVFLVEITQVADVRPAVDGVVVKLHFRVQREQLAVQGNGQGIDFNQHGVVVAEAAVQRLHQLHRGGQLLAAQSQMHGDLAALEVEQSDRGVHRFAHDARRLVARGLFDLDAAPLPRHYGHTLAGAVDDQAEIGFARDVDGLLDQHALHEFPLGAGLGGDQGPADHFIGRRAHFFHGVGQLYAARSRPILIRCIFSMTTSAWRIEAASSMRPSSITAPWPCLAASAMASRIRWEIGRAHVSTP